MELRDLQAFVAVATELHFGRAADRLYVSPSALSELIRRLENELRTPLFIRTTRRVELTVAGLELLGRAQTILDEVAGAKRAVAQIADGEAGTVRLGITPPAAPVLAPYLRERFAVDAPSATVAVQRMWLPDLDSALIGGEIDVAITCGYTPSAKEITTIALCADQLLVGLRADHRLARRKSIPLRELTGDRLGIHAQHLFPAWSASQQHALNVAGISPPLVELTDTDLVAGRWLNQPEVDWILLITSLSGGHTATVIRPTSPIQHVPFTISWIPHMAGAPVVERFVQFCLHSESPPGWVTGTGRSS